MMDFVQESKTDITFNVNDHTDGIHATEREDKDIPVINI